MPMYVRTPRNETVLREFGPYPGRLNLLGRKSTAVQRKIRRGGLAAFEPETMATLFTLVQESPRPVEFFDVGAHIGLYSSLISTIFPAEAVHVTAFEPSPDTADINRNVASVNHLSIHLEECAVGDEVGTATLYLSERAETSNSLVAGFRPSSRSVVVPKTSLDAYCEQHDVLPTVIKIDVETYESFVLKGAREILAKARPSVVCELLTRATGPETAEAMAQFDEYGYHVHRWMPDEGWQECPSSTVLDGSQRYIRDWLFTPELLTPRFHAAQREWLEAIATCTKDQNLMIPAGSKPPKHWDAPHNADQAG